MTTIQIFFFSILQRAGVVPMSIAGIAKEVTTITVSAWFFGDELTPLNIIGVAITVCGMCPLPISAVSV
jgi:solute carrier family 35 protein C2